MSSYELDTTFLERATREFHFLEGFRNQIYEEMPLMKRIMNNGVRDAKGESLIHSVVLARHASTGQVSGYGQVVLQETNLVTRASLDWANYYYATVGISLEEQDKNTGDKERLVNLLETKMNAAKAELKYKVYTDLYAAVTERAGKKTLVGLGAIVDDDNTYANINRSTAGNSGWQANVNGTGATDAQLVNPTSGALYFPTIIRKLLLDAAHDRQPSLVVMPTHQYELLEFLAETQNLRFLGNIATLAFDSMKMGKQGGKNEAAIVWDKHCTAQTVFCLTPEAFIPFVFPGRNFEAVPAKNGNLWRDGDRQLAAYMILVWSGQILCDTPREQAIATSVGDS